MHEKWSVKHVVADDEAVAVGRVVAVRLVGARVSVDSGFGVQESARASRLLLGTSSMLVELLASLRYHLD